MQNFCSCIENRIVYPILIKNNGKSYLTLYYYTEHSDSILHNDAKNLLFFQSTAEMKRFCKINELTIESDVVEYDFDTPISDPIDYNHVLDNWNLLNTIAGTFGMFFEGDRKKYNRLYDLLFRLNMPVEPIPPTYDIGEKNYKYILRVFRKKIVYSKKFCYIVNKYVGIFFPRRVQMMLLQITNDMSLRSKMLRLTV
ncbi:MAG: hypothetical protein IJX28_09150 [Clostridia bacterium]|nr:hypothetical protein [Clostridia bacterium]